MPILGRLGVGPVAPSGYLLGAPVTRSSIVVTQATTVQPVDTTPALPQAFGTLTAKPSWTNTAAASGPMDQPPVSTRTRTLALPNAPAAGGDLTAAWVAYFGNRSGTAGTKQAGDRVLIPGGAYTLSGNVEFPTSANDVEVVCGTEGNPTTLRFTQAGTDGLVTEHAIRNYGTNMRLRGVSATSPLLIETVGVAGRNGLNQQGNTCLLLDPGSSDTYVQDVILRGARAAGFFAYNSTRYWLNRVTAEDSLADGFHNTNGSSYGLFTDCVSRRAGDDGWAAVYYDGNDLASQSHHMEVYRLWTDTNGHGRGFANIGCTDIVADQCVIRGSAAAGVIVDREAISGGTAHGSIARVLLQRFRMEGCNWSEQDHGSVFLRNHLTNGTVTGVVMESFEIRDNPGHRQAVRTIGDGTTSTVLDVTLTDFRFTGGTNTAASDQFGGNNTSRIVRSGWATVDTTPGVENVRPTMVINTPGRNATVSGVLTGSTTDTGAMRNAQAVQFYAGDAGTKVNGTNVYDVVSVEVKVGDTVIGTVPGTALDVAKRGSQVWDTTAFVNGPALLQLTAIDKSGYTRTTSRQVTVSNATPGTTPGMPSDGSTTPVTPPPTPTALLADPFTRTSSTTAGTADTGQVWMPTGTWGTDGSTLGSVSKGDGNWISADVGTVVQEFEAKLTAGGANAYPGLLVNIEGGGSWYRAEWDPNGQITLTRGVNSAYTQLAQSAAGAMAVGRTIRMKSEIGTASTLLTVYVDNVQVLQGTDSWSAAGRAKPTGTAVGFRHGAAGTVDIRWDDAYVNRTAAEQHNPGTGTATVKLAATGAGSSTRSGSAAATGRLAATGAGSSTRVGSSTATVREAATGSGTGTHTAAATATLRPAATGTGTSSRTGVATATVRPTATGTATAAHTAASTATVRLTATGTGSGTRTGSSTATARLSATGAAASTRAGSGTGTVRMTASGTGSPAARAGTGTATVRLTAARAATSTRTGNNTATTRLTATGSGRAVHAGASTAAVRLTAAGTGAATRTGSSTATVLLAAGSTPTTRAITVAWSFDTDLNATTADGATGAAVTATNSPSGGNGRDATLGYPSPVYKLSGFASSSSQANANAYASFTVDPGGDTQWTPGTLAFRVARGGSSTPRGVVIRTSADGYAAPVYAADTPTVRTTMTSRSVDLSGIGPITGPLTVRIYVYGPTQGATQEFDDVTVTGASTAAASTRASESTATVRLTGTGSAAGTRTADGTATVRLSASGVGDSSADGAGTATVRLTASGTARSTRSGARTATVRAAGTGTANGSTRTGAATAAVRMTAAGSSGLTRAGAATATVRMTAAGTATARRTGSATATVRPTATGIATSRRTAAADGTVRVVGTGSASTVHSGAATGTVQLVAVGLATTVRAGLAAAELHLYAAGVATITRTGSGLATVRLTASGVGYVPSGLRDITATTSGPTGRTVTITGPVGRTVTATVHDRYPRS